MSKSNTFCNTFIDRHTDANANDDTKYKCELNTRCDPYNNSYGYTNTNTNEDPDGNTNSVNLTSSTFANTDDYSNEDARSDTFNNTIA